MSKKAKRKAKKSKPKARPSPKRKSAAKSAKKAKPAKATKPAAKAAPKAAGKNRIKSVSAIANMQPPRPFEFGARARVTVGNPGQRARLVPAEPPGFNPNILLLNVVVDQLPGSWPQVETDVDAAYADPDYRGSYSQVTVLYGNETKTANVQIVS